MLLGFFFIENKKDSHSFCLKIKAPYLGPCIFFVTVAPHDKFCIVPVQVRLSHTRSGQGMRNWAKTVFDFEFF